MKNIKVNKDICIGCGACMGTFPETFDINDEGLARVIAQNCLVEENEAGMMIETCPVGAIYIEE